MHSTDYNEILHTSRQLHCRDVCNISLWSVRYILNWSTPTFGRISNSIEISSVGRVPGTLSCGQDSATHLKIAHPHMKASGAQSLNEMQWLIRQGPRIVVPARPPGLAESGHEGVSALLPVFAIKCSKTGTPSWPDPAMFCFVILFLWFYFWVFF